MTEAIVVMSGGADSCISLFWALKKWKDVEAVTFHYGQRHDIEIECARNICAEVDIPHTTIQLTGWNQIKGSALLDKNTKIKTDKETGLPTSFVPGRNVVFLAYAAALAYTKKCHNIVTGVCQTDYSGYPDCRDSAIKTLQGALTLSFGCDMYVHTPLMWLTKAESILLARRVGALDYLGKTQTCYEGTRPACGKCPACKLRIQGFKEVGMKDPLEYEINIDWKEVK